MLKADPPFVKKRPTFEAGDDPDGIQPQAPTSKIDAPTD
jgi:hypothetical protein